MSMTAILSRQGFEELWREDEISGPAEKSGRAYYQHPDGEMFQIYDIHRDGTVVTDSGRTLGASEFDQCERLS